jgi:hypothetical protein
MEGRSMGVVNAMITQQVGTRVPAEALDRARQMYPETQKMTPHKLLRYLIAVAIGDDPRAFVEDPRKGKPRKQPEATD